MFCNRLLLLLFPSLLLPAHQISHLHTKFDKSWRVHPSNCRPGSRLRCIHLLESTRLQTRHCVWGAPSSPTPVNQEPSISSVRVAPSSPTSVKRGPSTSSVPVAPSSPTSVKREPSISSVRVAPSSPTPVRMAPSSLSVRMAPSSLQLLPVLPFAPIV